MRKLIAIIVVSIWLVACGNSESGKPDDSGTTTQSSDTSKKSIPSEVKKFVGNTDIKINYNAPAVRGRVIWGGLVPYDKVWVTGAHEATTLEIGKPFMLGGKTIPAGKYAIFTIPGKEEWTVIVNSNWDQHLADEYTAAQDMVRIKVKPRQHEEITERLKYEIDQRGERLADIIIRWEKLSVRFLIEIR
jgi:hypothetical protein